MLTETLASLPALGKISIRQLREADLEPADRILRDAFDRFTGVSNLFGTRDYVRSRWRTRPTAAITAESAGKILGSNFITDWGTVGFFGPLSVLPELWDRSIGKALVEATLDLLSAAGVRQAGLFTFPESAKHLGLYQRFGFWPQHLTCILGKQLSDARTGELPLLYSALASGEKEESLKACSALTDALFDGLDLSRDVRAVDEHGFGDTILLWKNSRLAAFAICHVGPRSEAGSELCYVKFAAVSRDRDESAKTFERLVGSCEAFARQQGARSIEIGVNTACREAYGHLLARQYKAQLQGVAMTRPSSPAYHGSGNFVLDDWR